ncbi:cysteine desulfurase family protein [Flavobacterium luminosum]|uniref:cysteine desulfurase n=1 Tax=Flavobacterium luminosum TaxID=2949086 RepID=A0ABT0TMU3_9FLAO|nr:cysteine desulfurase family protein [Flavobacterium sp. HXWNR70]MCL9808680.1 cysteine desulfurase [Flavobacterium sp. HXWNR70]
MKNIYLDNASTTPLRPEVIAEMTKVLTENFGNPSSTHAFGRSSKTLIELSRKSIAKNLNCSAQEIIFTSCGTEANNFILLSCIRDLKVERIITSKIEHHAVLHTLEVFEKQYNIQLDFVSILEDGTIDYNDLVELLSQNKKTLVSLMHVNNEIGTVLNLEKVSQLCKSYNAYFHTDTVQSIGKTEIDLTQLPIDFLVASAHKFHGPKGIGFAFIRKNIVLQPLLLGGEQEKGLRAGTESIHNIVGMAKALEMAVEHLETERNEIIALKNYFVEQLYLHFPEVVFAGKPEDTFYNVINVILPFDESKTSMLLFQLDMNGVAVSRGSACQSGSVKPSHVLEAFVSKELLQKPNIRVSFSHYNTKEDVDYLLEVLKKI